MNFACRDDTSSTRTATDNPWYESIATRQADALVGTTFSALDDLLPTRKRGLPSLILIGRDSDCPPCRQAGKVAYDSLSDFFYPDNIFELSLSVSASDVHSLLQEANEGLRIHNIGRLVRERLVSDLKNASTPMLIWVSDDHTEHTSATADVWFAEHSHQAQTLLLSFENSVRSLLAESSLLPAK